MKLIIACDQYDLTAFLSVAERCVPHAGADVLFAFVVDTSIEQDWNTMAGHRWFRRHPGARDHAHFQDSDQRASQRVLRDAMDLSGHWPAADRRTVELYGNPERELVRLARAEAADLVVIGQRRLELGPHALGRCARFVVDHAPCSVLLIRTDALRAAASELLGDRLTRQPKPPDRLGRQ